MALSTVDSIQSGDTFVISNSQNADYRTASQNVFLAWIKTAFASPEPTSQLYTPANGFNITMTQDGTSSWLLLRPASTLATGTIVIPSSSVAVDGQEIECSSTNAVTSLSVTSAGATINGAPTTIAANGYFKLKYNTQTLSWYKVS